MQTIIVLKPEKVNSKNNCNNLSSRLSSHKNIISRFIIK